jgi:nitroimidazol reductase NimA-like FMN-containing flavoprotein (pyridoxamine 5'-phosphate oxidase superfamily)
VRIFDQRVSVLTTQQSRELLDTTPVGRVVFTDRALPAVLPVAFVLDADSVVIRTARGSRLARAARDAVLAFEADHISPRTQSGWSVVVTGQAEVETDPGEIQRLGALLRAWVPGLKDVFIRIPLTVVTGRRVGRLSAAVGE